MLKCSDFPKFLIWLCFLITSFCGGCQQASEQVTTPQVSRNESGATPPVTAPSEDRQQATSAESPVVLRNPAVPLLVEEQAQALPIWREYKDVQPTLVVFSAKPPRPVPDGLKDEVAKVLTSGAEMEIVRRTARPVADRLLGADMGVSAAIAQGWLSRVVWVVPLGEGEIMRPLDDFKYMLRERVPGWDKAIDSFWDSGAGSFTGELSGVRIEVVPVQLLPSIDGPLLLHIDAGYFAALYRNEVKTPLFEMMRERLKHVAERGYNPLAVTVSRDTQSYEIPLSLRFMAKSLAEVLADPQKLQEPSDRMKLRREIEYLDNFFQPQTIAEKAQELMRLDPRDGDAVYAYYLALRQAKQLDRALEVLNQVLLLDPGYADTFVELVQHAAQKGQLEAALAMLEHAQTAQPDNPMIGLRKAEVLVEMGRSAEATPILKELAQLPWSEVYYPRVRQDIAGLLQKVRNLN